jgi:hypothetical protein
MHEHVQNVDAAVEGLGRADAIAGDLGGGGLTGKLATRADEGLVKAQQTTAATGPAEEPVVVLGSGNLGLVYLRDARRRTLEDLDREWPALVPGLAAHPGVGFVACLDARGVPWAIGAEGRHDLSTGEVQGDDPLAPFGAHAARVLRRAVTMPTAPDLYVNSTVDPVTLDVHAFEGLVGSHGGLGGWQDHAVLLGPADLMVDLPEHIEGADALHEVLVGMLEQCGQRAGTAGAVSPSQV